MCHTRHKSSTLNLCRIRKTNTFPGVTISLQTTLWSLTHIEYSSTSCCCGILGPVTRLFQVGTILRLHKSSLWILYAILDVMKIPIFNNWCFETVCHERQGFREILEEKASPFPAPSCSTSACSQGRSSFLSKTVNVLGDLWTDTQAGKRQFMQ